MTASSTLLTGDAVGIDGYPKGWVAARLTDGRLTWDTCPVAEVHTLIPPDVVVGVDMPIGLVDTGWRDCDRAAAAALGARRSSVFMTPPREVLQLHASGASKESTQRASRALTGAGTSVFALALARRILVLEAALDDHPEHRVVEVHPELSFAELAGAPLERKTSGRGVAQRIAALQPAMPSVLENLARAPVDVPIDDALDALAALWSAVRWRDGSARTLPSRATDPPLIAI